MSEISCYITDRENADFIDLCRLLNAELEARLSGGVDPIASRANKTEDFTDAIIAAMDGIPVGCIALRPFSEECAEIKRMYVLPDKRRSGIGRLLLENCIALARSKGYQSVVLETNEKLPEAKRFYQKAGFSKTTSYGPYAALEETLCMKKDLRKEFCNFEN